MNNYGIFKQLCDDNNYSVLAKTLSSAKSTFETQKTLKRITQKHIKYAHMGQLVIRDGICYTTFIQNPGDDTEFHYSKTSSVVLSVFTLDAVTSDSFDPEKDVKNFKVGAMGDFCAGHKALSIYKDNSMCLVGNLLYVCFSFIAEDEKSHIFCKAFDINSQSWVKESLVTLKYKDKDYDFSDETLNKIYLDKNLQPRAKGLIEMVSAWNE